MHGGYLGGSEQVSADIVAAQTARAMEDTECPVGILMHPHLGLHIVTPVAVLRDLQHPIVVAYGIVIGHGALLLPAFRGFGHMNGQARVRMRELSRGYCLEVGRKLEK